MVHSKYAAEDPLADVKDHILRDSKNPTTASSPERTFFNTACSSKHQQGDFKAFGMVKGDMSRAAASHASRAQARSSHFGCEGVRSPVTRMVSEITKAETKQPKLTALRMPGGHAAHDGALDTARGGPVKE